MSIGDLIIYGSRDVGIVIKENNPSKRQYLVYWIKNKTCQIFDQRSLHDFGARIVKPAGHGQEKVLNNPGHSPSKGGARQQRTGKETTP